MASVSVEAGVGPSGAPIATVILSDWGMVTVKVSRIVAGRETVVRGGRALEVLGAGSLVDFDVPVGVEVEYVAESVSDRETATVTVESAFGWLTDPNDPSVAVSFAARAGTGADVFMQAGMLGSGSLTASVETTPIIGADLPVVTGGQRQRAASIPMVFVGMDAAGVEKMTGLLDTGGPVVVVRPPAGMPLLDPVAYCAIPDVTATPFGAPSGLPYVSWSGSATQVRPFAAPVAWTFFTYDSVAQIFVGASLAALTYAQVQAFASAAGYTYADMVRDPQIGGALA